MIRRTLLIHAIISLVSTMAFASTECDRDVLKTPAVYFEFVGMSDKPIYPIVIAVREPSTQELTCALKSQLRSGAMVFVVDQKSLADADKLIESSFDQGKSENPTFMCVLVKAASVRRSGLGYTASKKLFADLRSHFSNHHELHARLETLLRRLGG